MQKEDFISIFKIMGDFPVTIRLLDPPLHEFLPHSEEEMQEVAKASRREHRKIAPPRQRALKESNPMLGHRGCRLGITYPEIYEMQATCDKRIRREPVRAVQAGRRTFSYAPQSRNRGAPAVVAGDAAHVVVGGQAQPEWAALPDQFRRCNRRRAERWESGMQSGRTPYRGNQHAPATADFTVYCARHHVARREFVADALSA